MNWRLFLVSVVLASGMVIGGCAAVDSVADTNYDEKAKEAFFNNKYAAGS